MTGDENTVRLVSGRGPDRDGWISPDQMSGFESAVVAVEISQVFRTILKAFRGYEAEDTRQAGPNDLQFSADGVEGTVTYWPEGERTALRVDWRLVRPREDRDRWLTSEYQGFFDWFERTHQPKGSPGLE
jgi:hypothetical protein